MLAEDEHANKVIMGEYVRRFGVASPDRARPWCPQVPFEKQIQFLNLTNREAFYGGKSGGGKTSCLLMAALKYVHVPYYAAIIFRRTYKDLAEPDAVMDRSHRWLDGTEARWKAEEYKWVFPSNAILKFAYIENDRDLQNYQGAAFQFIGFDELTHFTEKQYLYMMSRLRKPNNSDLPLVVRSTGNPGGIGHDFVFKRFVDDNHPPENVFIPASLEDNVGIDQDSYRANLELLDATTKAQLLHGIWIKDSTGLIYPYSDKLNGVDTEPTKELDKILAIDFGASIQKATTAFAVVGFSKTDPYSVWGIESYAESGMIPSTIADEIRAIKERHEIVKVVADAGALGVGYIEELKRRHHMWIEPAKKSDKRGYRKLMRGDLERGAFKLIRDSNAALIEEYQSLCWDEHGIDTAKGAEDHLSDAMLYAWREARYYYSKEVPVIPKPGTQERYDWEEDKIQKYMDNVGQKKKRGGFNYDSVRST